jgi:GNAT superfamily N-acetyltransferase
VFDDAVFVAPEHHREGIGRALVKRLVEDARAAGLRRLRVSASLDAVGFYEAL